MHPRVHYDSATGTYTCTVQIATDDDGNLADHTVRFHADAGYCIDRVADHLGRTIDHYDPHEVIGEIHDAFRDDYMAGWR